MSIQKQTGKDAAIGTMHICQMCRPFCELLFECDVSRWKWHFTLSLFNKLLLLLTETKLDCDGSIPYRLKEATKIKRNLNL